MINIPYSNKHKYSNLVFAIIWISLALFNKDYDYSWEISSIIYLVTGVIYAVLSINFLFYPYVSWDGIQFKITQLMGYSRTIKAKDINNITLFGGEYTLFTNERKVRIKSVYLDKEAIITLNKVLAKVELPSDKSPFASA
ncbi:hypothetical protein [Flavobacterium sp. ASW18X]|uniref:hypothetical protein n=1 Tax=Flavobacterium sp. ASW18X TaxID=2572595 RepID=UPI0010AE7EA3|nr:hypothetical protein [Flavobacterium sp. ASW18X]TKD56545.1 hypothetical protein FBT53_15580 [Flavobacterium sp. ASW18X]